MTDGFLVVDKPLHKTSAQAVAVVKKLTGAKKVGHGGTLDPLATGVLVIGVGSAATRRLGEFLHEKKKYLAEIELGRTSETYDLEGPITTVEVKSVPSLEEVEIILDKFRGEINQMPPIYSAKKIQGQAAYKLAREGKPVLLQPKTVTVYELKLIEYVWPILKLELLVSSGTYIRSLANDIGTELQVGGLLASLRRFEQGRFSIDQATELSELTPQLIKEKIWQVAR